jgi:hypothetical protein
VWPSRVSSNIQVALELAPVTDPVAGVLKLPAGDAAADAVLSVQILRRLSEPAVINRWTAGGVPDAVEPLLEGRKEGVISVPGRTEGDQEIELQPVAWAVNRDASHVPSSSFGRQLCEVSMEGKPTFESKDGNSTIARCACQYST